LGFSSSRSFLKRKLARLQFISYCAAYHGTYGRGHGPTAKNMIPKPGNWTDSSWQESHGPDGDGS
jgi:hypothetical protein